MERFLKFFLIVIGTVGYGQEGRSSEKSTCSSSTTQEKFEQGMALSSDPSFYSAAYSAPATIVTARGWDFNVFGSFIYWHVSEESLDLAVTPALAVPSNFVRGEVAVPTFSYEPGFKIGIGADTNWDGFSGWVEWTRLHQTTTSTALTPVDRPFDVIWTIPDPGGLASEFNPNEIQSSWKMNLDIIDAVVGRPFYQGRYLTISPYVGARALWIKQGLTIFGNNADAPPGAYQSQAFSSYGKSLGMVLGSSGHLLLGKGFRLESKLEGSLLYTHYKTEGTQGDFSESLSPPTTIVFNGYKYNMHTLRPTADLGIGAGWSDYLWDQLLYIDCSLRYDFNILWDQNVMVYAFEEFIGVPGRAANLFLHGITLSARVDF